MKKTTVRGAFALGAGAAILASTLVACTPQAAPNGDVVISIGDRPASSEPERQQAFDDAVAAFEEANPTIDLEPKEVVYDQTAFQAQLAGGELPTVIGVPFTDIQGLIASQQVADITAAVAATGLADRLNPTSLAVAQSGDQTFGIPSGAYSIGLVYNRELFEQAGLDPDAPPTTWDEVREFAKKITDTVGVPGFAILSQQNTGGWMFTAMSYSFGGRIENEEGTEVTFDDEGSRAALQLLHDMRFDDGSIGDNVLHDGATIAQALGSGQLGMFAMAPEIYQSVVIDNGLTPEAYGAGPMPQGDGVNGTLIGGTVQIVNTEATEAEKEAAVKWVDFFYLSKFTDKDVAVDLAESAEAAGNPVGIPGVPLVSDASIEQYDSWIEPYVNVPVANFQPWIDSLAELPLIPEPKNKAQDVYAALDSVIQAVLTDPNLDIDALLAEQKKTLDALLAR
jgi:ABC-type glycerol-3-phosphate transport system substrate-binding protein